MKRMLSLFVAVAFALSMVGFAFAAEKAAAPAAEKAAPAVEKAAPAAEKAAAAPPPRRRPRSRRRRRRRPPRRPKRRRPTLRRRLSCGPARPGCEVTAVPKKRCAPAKGLRAGGPTGPPPVFFFPAAKDDRDKHPASRGFAAINFRRRSVSSHRSPPRSSTSGKARGGHFQRVEERALSRSRDNRGERN